MVSRYRDIIENSSSKGSLHDGQKPITSRHNSRLSSKTDEESLSTNGTAGKDQLKTIELEGSQKSDSEESTHSKETNSADKQQANGDAVSERPVQISSIQVKSSDSYIENYSSPNVELPEYPKTVDVSFHSNVNIAEKLEKALSSVAPFLKDIFIEFSHLLSKIIVGSHGQELISSGLSALKHNSSVIELVMLLCSQEWQTSLQKYTGLSFIELVNEGRLFSHASKDHVVRVSNEAEFILNRLRAEDVKKHADFEQMCGKTSMERKEEENICEHLISAARKRDHFYAIRLKEKILNIITDKHGCWYDLKSESFVYWKLDNWEDDLRRRRRFVKNPNGSSHLDAILKSDAGYHKKLEEQDSLNAKNELFKQFSNMKGNLMNASNSLSEEEQLIEEKDLDLEITGPVHYSYKCKLICPVCVVCGTLSITVNEIYFEVDENDETFKSLDPNLLCYIETLHGKWHFNEIRAIFSRRYLMQNTAIEIFTASRNSFMFAFNDRQTVKKVINILPRVGVGPRYGLPQARRTSLASAQQLFRSSNMTQRWQRREISNFEYLMYLNTISGRTFNDLNQYPVFPWILINYDSATIDLNSPASYRDLSKPVGALNPSRKQIFEERFNTWDNTSIPAFHYGTHYSTAAFTLNWLIRVEPFTSIFLNLQGGKFDHADRIFSSVSTSWKNSQRDTSDVKELTPEFFYLPEMFVNLNKLHLGETQQNVLISDVELPKWAANAHEFVRINRQALESEFVSCQLHQWIDLVFGYKQRGPEAVRACNVFYYLTYEGAINTDNIDDALMKAAIEAQIKNFGQTPSQLLNEPHQPRSSAMAVSPMMYSQASDDICMMMKFLSNAAIIHVSANTFASLQNPAVITISSKHEFSVNKYNGAASASGSTAAAGAYGDAQAHSQAPINTQAFVNAAATSKQAPTPQQIQQSLPVQMDPLLVFSTGLHKRQLGDNFDDKMHFGHNNFIVTYDNRFVIASGFWDKSFRVFSTETAKLVQVVYGHYDLVTCVSRSEMTQNGNCFVATGSRDSTIMIWIWNGSKGMVINKDLSVVGGDDNPSPGALLTGHSKQIVAIIISSEIGVVVSASDEGPVLLHTVYGDLLRQFEQADDFVSPYLMHMSQDGENIVVAFKSKHVVLYTVNGKLLKSVATDDKVMTMAINNDGQFLVVGTQGGSVSVFKTHELTPVYVFPVCDTSIRSLALTHDQKYIIAGLSTGCLIVFNVNFNVIAYRNRMLTKA